METTKTLWKKNLDSKYISGEDLQLSNKGLKPEMVVTIERFNDDKTFDKQKNSDVIVSALYLKEVNGAALYKPVVLNRTNAKFFVKETGSDFMEDWLNKPVIVYAQKDSRHGFVVRFKSYVKPNLVKDSEMFKQAKIALEKGTATMDKIKSRYQVSTEVEGLLNAK
jgi:hypothetical protein